MSSTDTVLKQYPTMMLDNIKNKIESSEAIQKHEVTAFFQVVLDLYKNNRIAHTVLEADGDMLLFQWGTYDWGNGKYFNIDITRQIMEDIDDPDEQAGTIQQLSVSLLFVPDIQSEAIGSGNQWCNTPDKLDEFENYINNSKAYKLSRGKIPESIEITMNYV